MRTPKTKQKSQAAVALSALLANTPSNVMEMVILRRAIRRTDDNILRILTELENLRTKQHNRQKELARMSAKTKLML